MSSPGLQGLRPWIIQRITAVFIAFVCVYFLVSFFSFESIDFEQWHQWVYSPFNTVLLSLFLIAVLWHAWVGVRDVILDYFPNVIIRLLLLSLVAGVLLASMLWGLRALLVVIS
ncbi:MAG: succinate dehydrogenase, hydrophobic membrane anchor protein [Gammaproteobacteria bacterium]|nr:succinate dehydrogenase, hydrophobic membrane anchor protein [Gammaproteobacteria bacterium]